MKETIKLSDDIYKAATAAANRSGVTLSEYVEDAVRTALGRSDDVFDGPITLPAFNCGGAPLVDLDDKDALWGILDDRP